MTDASDREDSRCPNCGNKSNFQRYCEHCGNGLDGVGESSCVRTINLWTGFIAEGAGIIAGAWLISRGVATDSWFVSAVAFTVAFGSYVAAQIYVGGVTDE